MSTEKLIRCVVSGVGLFVVSRISFHHGFKTRTRKLFEEERKKNGIGIENCNKGTGSGKKSGRKNGNGKGLKTATKERER